MKNLQGGIGSIRFLPYLKIRKKQKHSVSADVLRRRGSEQINPAKPIRSFAQPSL